MDMEISPSWTVEKNQINLRLVNREYFEVSEPIKIFDKEYITIRRIKWPSNKDITKDTYLIY